MAKSTVTDLADKYSYVLDKYQRRLSEAFYSAGEIEYRSSFNVAQDSVRSLYIRLLKEMHEQGDINE